MTKENLKATKKRLHQRKHLYLQCSFCGIHSNIHQFVISINATSNATFHYSEGKATSKCIKHNQYRISVFVITLFSTIPIRFDFNHPITDIINEYVFKRIDKFCVQQQCFHLLRPLIAFKNHFLLNSQHYTWCFYLPTDICIAYCSLAVFNCCSDNHF